MTNNNNPGKATASTEATTTATHDDESFEVVIGEAVSGKCEALEGAEAEDVAGRLHVDDLERNLEER